ncbi:MAG: hypothetical protein ACLR6J_14990 [Parabacteroides merdae]
MEAPVVNVGIMTEKAVSFVFHGEYVHTETGKFLTGEQRALFVTAISFTTGGCLKKYSLNRLPLPRLSKVKST